MKETAQILQLWRTTQARNEEAVLATVIRTRGSSYRLPGARLLVARNGQHAGSISGGCLEEDLLKKAWWLTEAGPAIRRYDTTADGEIGSGYGLGCNGIIHIHIERFLPQQPNVLSRIEAVWQTRKSEQFAHPAIDKEEPFVETIEPPVRLLIFGAGDDAIPVAQLAHFLGWETYIYDGRSHYAKPDRFPFADQVQVRSAETLIPIDDWTVAVLMSHSYSQDLQVLEQLAQNPPAYVGLLGPRKRSVQILADAGLGEEQLEPALHAPMGLDIGADGPQQVAMAVLAEVQGFLNGRNGGSLRNRRGSIHARDLDGDEQPFRVQSIACA